MGMWNSENDAANFFFHLREQDRAARQKEMTFF